jgi:hypothetical protein
VIPQQKNFLLISIRLDLRIQVATRGCRQRGGNTYRQGLTGHMAEWAVQKQKSHQRVGQHTMLSMEAVLN